MRIWLQNHVGNWYLYDADNLNLKSLRGIEIGQNVTFGDNCKISNKVVIEDNCILGNDVFIGYEVVIKQNTEIRNNVDIGDYTLIMPNCRIKEYCKIGIGCVIMDNTIIEKCCVLGNYCKVQENSHITHSWLQITGSKFPVIQVSEDFQLRIGCVTFPVDVWEQEIDNVAKEHKLKHLVAEYKLYIQLAKNLRELKGKK